MDAELEVLESQQPPGRVRRRRLRGAPRWALGVVAVASVAALATYASMSAQRPPDLRDLSVQSVAVHNPQTEWPQADTRPAGPVVVDDAVLVLRVDEGAAAGERWTVRVTGWSGPGVALAGEVSGDRSGDPEVELSSNGQPGTARVSLAVDCRTVPLPVVPADYSWQAEVSAGGPTSTGSIRWEGENRDWADHIEAQCAVVEAQRGMRVTAAALAGDQPDGQARVLLDVANRSERPALITGSEGPAGLSPLPPQRLGPGASSTVSLDMPLDQCPPNLADYGAGGGAPSTPVSVLIEFPGVVSPTGWWAPPAAGWEPAAAASLIDLLTQACAGVSSVRVGPGATPEARFDPQSRVYDGVLAVALPAGWRGLVTVRPEDPYSQGRSHPAYPAYPLGMDPYPPIPRWDGVGPVAPDAHGAARVPVRYEVPEGSFACTPTGLDVLLEVRVRTSADTGGREAGFEVLGLAPWPEGLDPSTVCAW